MVITCFTLLLSANTILATTTDNDDLAIEYIQNGEAFHISDFDDTHQHLGLFCMCEVGKIAFSNQEEAMRIMHEKAESSGIMNFEEFDEVLCIEGGDPCPFMCSGTYIGDFYRYGDTYRSGYHYESLTYFTKCTLREHVLSYGDTYCCNNINHRLH